MWGGAGYGGKSSPRIDITRRSQARQNGRQPAGNSPAKGQAGAQNQTAPTLEHVHQPAAMRSRTLLRDEGNTLPSYTNTPHALKERSK